MRNPLTIEAFADWLAKQPAAKRYDYTNPRECPIACYLRAVGLPCYSVVGNGWYDEGYDYHHLPERFDQIACGLDDDRALRANEWIYGRAAERAFAKLKAQARA